RLLLQEAELVVREAVVVPVNAPAQRSPDERAELVEEARGMRGHPAQDALDEVPVTPEDARERVRELVRRVVDLDAVDDLGAIDPGHGKLEAEEVRRVRYVNSLQIEIAVGGRKAVGVGAAQVDDDVLTPRLLLVENALHHGCLPGGEHFGHARRDGYSFHTT